jgi:hypothetical protein
MNKTESTLASRPANEEELFYLKLARDEFAASLGRSEEVAKYLIAAVGATVGFVFAGAQIKQAIRQALAGSQLTVPFLLWSVSLLFAILVFFPLPYRHYQNSPQSIRGSLNRARWVKWIFLLLAALSFAAGMIIAAVQF